MKLTKGQIELLRRSVLVYSIREELRDNQNPLPERTERVKQLDSLYNILCGVVGVSVRV